MKYFTGDWFADNYIMTDILSQVDYYSGTERKKILKTPKGTGSMLYGVTWRGYLSEIFSEFGTLYFPDFKYLQVQMNYNYGIGKHTDSKNVGESVLCCFGDYTGGETMVDYGKGTVLSYDARQEPVRFNGSKYEHWVAPYKGNRYSLVFFNNIKRKLILRLDSIIDSQTKSIQKKLT